MTIDSEVEKLKKLCPDLDRVEVAKLLEWAAQEANKAVVAELKTIVTFEGVVSKEIVLHKVMERITDRIALLTADKELNNG